MLARYSECSAAIQFEYLEFTDVILQEISQFYFG